MAGNTNAHQGLGYVVGNMDAHKGLGCAADNTYAHKGLGYGMMTGKKKDALVGVLDKNSLLGESHKSYVIKPHGTTW